MGPKERRAALEVIAEKPQTSDGDRIKAIQLLEQLADRGPAYDPEFYRDLEKLDGAELERELEAFDVPLASEQAAVDREIRRIELDPKLRRRALEREALRQLRIRKSEQSG